MFRSFYNIYFETANFNLNSDLSLTLSWCLYYKLWTDFTFFWCFHSCLWTSKCRLRLVVNCYIMPLRKKLKLQRKIFVVETFFRKTTRIWRAILLRKRAPRNSWFLLPHENWSRSTEKPPGASRWLCTKPKAGVDKFNSLSPIFRARNFTCAPDRTRQKRAHKTRVCVQSTNNWKHCFSLFISISIKNFCNEAFVVRMLIEYLK